jgi:myo-inositol 2-dehydrogenase/D-chiro-inositol 1-dehydrogenase
MHVGVLGVGRIGSFHATTLSRSRHVTQLTIWDPRIEATDSVASKIDAQVAESPDDLLECGLDAVLICSSSATHADLLEAAVDKQIPVFCEKPIALDLDRTRRLVEEIERSGTPATIGFQRRSDPAYRALRTEIASGQLGTLYLARLVVGDDTPPPADYVAGSGGIHLDQSVHDFDIIRFLTGQEAVEVYATGAALTGAPGVEDSGDVDSAATVLTLSRGTIAVLTSSRHSSAGYDVRLEIAGSKAVRTVGPIDRRDDSSGVGNLATPQGGFLARFEAAYRAEIDRFLQFISGNDTNPCTPADALCALEIAVAATESRHINRPVRLAPSATIARGIQL